MPIMRRSKRSNCWHAALKYWLEAVAKKTQLEGILLADKDGFLVASSFEDASAAELAAEAPLVVRYGHENETMVVNEFDDTEKQRFFLCAVGGIDCPTVFNDAATGVRRIMATC